MIGGLAALVVSVPGLVALSGQTWDVGARAVGHGARSGRHRAVLATQIALCFVLACGAALFSTHMYALRQLPLGYEPAGLQWARLDSTSRTAVVPAVGYVDTLLAQITALPGVEGAAMSTSFGIVSGVGDGIAVKSDASDAAGVSAIADRVSPGFFRTASIPLHQGREFTWNEVSSDGGVAIVSRSLAGRLFPDGEAVGRTLKVGAREQVFSGPGRAGWRARGACARRRSPR